MPKPLTIGVFAPYSVQFLDLATIDILGTMSHAYLSSLSSSDPRSKTLATLASEITILYISSPEQGPDIKMSANASLKATNMFTDPEVAPGKLDVVIVPGCSPKQKFDPAVLDWLRRQGGTEGTDVLSVCTGVFLCGEAGLGDGRRVSGPRFCQGELKERFPKMELVGAEYRWVRDGNFWSSGGVTNGNELVAAYAKESGRFHREVAEFGCQLTEVGDRGQKYE